jgi:hypothetical protein
MHQNQKLSAPSVESTKIIPNKKKIAREKEVGSPRYEPAKFVFKTQPANGEGVGNSKFTFFANKREVIKVCFQARILVLSF